MLMMIWVLVPCGLVGTYQRFGISTEDGDIMFLRNAGTYQLVYTVPKPRRTSSEFVLHYVRLKLVRRFIVICGRYINNRVSSVLIYLQWCIVISKRWERSGGAVFKTGIFRKGLRKTMKKHSQYRLYFSLGDFHTNVIRMRCLFYVASMFVQCTVFDSAMQIKSYMRDNIRNSNNS
jgi:hypothetical protein